MSTLTSADRPYRIGDGQGCLWSSARPAQELDALLRAGGLGCPPPTVRSA